MTLDRIKIDSDPCPDCRSPRVSYDSFFRCWSCEDCGTNWGFAQGDQDSEDPAGLIAHIEADMTLDELRRETEGKP